MAESPLWSGKKRAIFGLPWTFTRYTLTETCLFIRWKLTNRGGESAAFIASDFAVDGVPLDLPAEYLGTVQPGQTAYAVSKITAPEADFPFASGTRISLTFETEVENGFGLWEPVEFALP